MCFLIDNLIVLLLLLLSTCTHYFGHDALALVVKVETCVENANKGCPCVSREHACMHVVVPFCPSPNESYKWNLFEMNVRH